MEKVMIGILIFIVGVAVFGLYINVRETRACENRGGVLIKSAIWYECVALEKR